MSRLLVLGGGVSGIAAGLASGAPVIEAASRPGGICRSYYVDAHGERHPHRPPDRPAWRFELGGGHWIFGDDPAVLALLGRHVRLRRHRRRAAVLLPELERIVPYPLQHQLRLLPRELAACALAELLRPKRDVTTLGAWLDEQFGPTLSHLFFRPFHDLYTAGLTDRIAPQDPHKSPLDPALVVQGALGEVEEVGYNVTFAYPEEGLDVLVDRLAGQVRLRPGAPVVAIRLRERAVELADGTVLRFDVLISTLPLDRTLELAGLEAGEPPDPATSVLVANIGARRGPACPDVHWLYVPKSRTGFHRVGFYSNVDPGFLPRHDPALVSLYVERAFPRGARLPAAEVDAWLRDLCAELQERGWIGPVEVATADWIETAYTWRWPGSRWREKGMDMLLRHGIFPTGRYGRWHFQGILESLREGLAVGAGLRAAEGATW